MFRFRSARQPHHVRPCVVRDQEGRCRFQFLGGLWDVAQFEMRDLAREIHVRHAIEEFTVAPTRRPRFQERGEISHFLGVRPACLGGEQFLQLPVLGLLRRRETGENQIPDLLGSGALFRESDHVTFIGSCDERCGLIRVRSLEFIKLEECIQFGRLRSHPFPTIGIERKRAPRERRTLIGVLIHIAET